MNLRLQKYDAILAMVQAIPAGKVASYGQIAELAGLPGRARLVGKVMATLPFDSGVPWHRVVNAQGAISWRGNGESVTEQALLLRAEGVAIGENGRVHMAEFRWSP